MVDGIIQNARESNDQAQKSSLIQKIQADLYTEQVKTGRTPNKDKLIEIINEKYGTVDGENFISKEGNYTIALTEILGWERKYSREGLILYLDAINNVGEGDDNHSSTTTVWKDLSGNGNDAKLINGPTWKEKSLYFDGVDDYVSAQLNVISDFSIEFVAKNIDLSDSNTDRFGSLFMINSWSSKVVMPSLQIFYDKRSNNIIRSRYLVPEISSEIPYMEKSTNSFEKFDNVYYTITKSNSEIKVFINGKFNETINQSDFVDRLKLTKMNIEISRWYGGSSSSVKQNVNSMRIYNRALTDEEIMNNYEIDKERFSV